jgi:hypothetical protein
LVGDAVDLRLVAGDGSVAHARRFLKDGLYIPVRTRLLRKADGTAFFILPAVSDASFAQGSYRTVMDFMKDNTDVVADNIILSEAGETAPEFAVLNIPWPV